jgi:hypothetical protein
MKKIMKLIGVAALALAAVLITSTASAQVAIYSPVTIAATPATLATTVTTNFATPPLIDCRKQQNVFLMFSFNQASACTSNVVYTLYKSVDGTYFDVNNPITITIASQGATRVNYGTNINVAGAGYLELYSIANATSLVTMTNYGAVYGLKMGAP